MILVEAKHLEPLGHTSVIGKATGKFEQGHDMTCLMF